MCAWGGSGWIIFKFDPVPLLPLGMMLVIAIQSAPLLNSGEFCSLSINLPLAQHTAQAGCLSYRARNKGHTRLRVSVQQPPKQCLVPLGLLVELGGSSYVYKCAGTNLSAFPCILNCIFSPRCSIVNHRFLCLRE